jgi:hypothetical protein
MRLIYTRDGFSKNEKAEWRIIIFQNIVDGLRMIVDAMEEFQIPFEYDNTTVSLPRRCRRRRNHRWMSSCLILTRRPRRFTSRLSWKSET